MKCAIFHAFMLPQYSLCPSRSLLRKPKHSKTGKEAQERASLTKRPECSFLSSCHHLSFDKNPYDSLDKPSAKGSAAQNMDFLKPHPTMSDMDHHSNPEVEEPTSARKLLVYLLEHAPARIASTVAEISVSSRSFCEDFVSALHDVVSKTGLTTAQFRAFWLSGFPDILLELLCDAELYRHFEVDRTRWVSNCTFTLRMEYLVAVCSWASSSIPKNSISCSKPSWTTTALTIQNTKIP